MQELILEATLRSYRWRLNLQKTHDPVGEVYINYCRTSHNPNTQKAKRFQGERNHSKTASYWVSVISQPCTKLCKCGIQQSSHGPSSPDTIIMPAPHFADEGRGKHSQYRMANTRRGRDSDPNCRGPCSTIAQGHILISWGSFLFSNGFVEI